MELLHLALWLTLQLSLYLRADCVFTLQTFIDTELTGAVSYTASSICDCKKKCLVDKRCMGVTVKEDGGDPLCSALLEEEPSPVSRRKRSADPEVKSSKVFVSDSNNLHSFIKMYDDGKIVVEYGGQPGSSNPDIPKAASTPTSTNTPTTTSTTTTPTTSSTTTTPTTTSTTTSSTTTTEALPVCNNPFGGEPYIIFKDANGKRDGTIACFKAGRTIAAIKSQKDLDCFFANIPDDLTSGTPIYVALKKANTHLQWYQWDTALWSTYLGKRKLPLENVGAGLLLVEFDTNTKNVVGFRRQNINQPLEDKSVICMDATGSRTPDYISFPLNDNEWYDEAMQKCITSNKVLAIVKTKQDYNRLKSQLTSVTRYGIMALKGGVLGYEWDESWIKMGQTDIYGNKMMVHQNGGGSVKCFYVSSFDPDVTATPRLTLLNGGCDVQGKVACTSRQKMAVTGQTYEYQTLHITPIKSHWGQLAAAGLQHAVLKTKEHINGVIADITLTEPEIYLTVSMYWNIYLEIVLWEDNTPFESTPLANDPSTVEVPPNNMDCYYVHFSNGEYKGFTGDSTRCSHQEGTALGMVALP